MRAGSSIEGRANAATQTSREPQNNDDDDDDDDDTPTKRSLTSYFPACCACLLAECYTEPPTAYDNRLVNVFGIVL